MTIEVFHTSAAKRHRVCVTPCTKGFNATVSTTTTPQGRGAVDRYHSLPNEDSDSPVVKSRKDAFWTYLPNELLSKLSNSIGLFPWSFTFPPPNLAEFLQLSFAADSQRASRFCRLEKQFLLKHLQVLGLLAMQFCHLPSQRGN